VATIIVQTLELVNEHVSMGILWSSMGVASSFSFFGKAFGTETALFGFTFA